MTKYLIGYDLNAPGQKWAQLDAAMPKMGFAIKLQETLWLLVTSWNEAQVSERLTAIIDDNDLLVILETSGVGRVSGYSTQELAEMRRLCALA